MQQLPCLQLRALQLLEWKMSQKRQASVKDLPIFITKTRKTYTWHLLKKAFEQLKDEFRESLRTKGKNGLEMLTDLVQRIWKFAKEQPVYYHSIIHFLDLLKNTLPQG